MSLWHEANEIEKISNQISCLGNVLEMVAEKDRKSTRLNSSHT